MEPETTGTTSENKGAASAAWRAFLVTLAVLAAVGLAAAGALILASREPEKAAKTGEALNELKTAAKRNARRADAIAEAAKEKEAKAVHETKARVHDAPADRLPALLLGLLREWRAEQDAENNSGS